MKRKSFHRGPGTLQGLGQWELSLLFFLLLPILRAAWHPTKAFLHLNPTESLFPLAVLAVPLDDTTVWTTVVDSTLGVHKDSLSRGKIGSVSLGLQLPKPDRLFPALCCPLLAQSLKSQLPTSPAGLHLLWR